MSSDRGERTPLAVGIDLGGTWVRIVATGTGRAVRFARRTGRAPELESLLRGLWRRRGWAPRRVGALVLAARGVWTARERRAMGRRLRGLARRVRVLSDAEAALLGALGGRPGVLVLAGTGSIVLGRDARARRARAGGLGPLLGDEGSAFWLGREWLRGDADDAPHVRRLVAAPDAVARIARLAPTVVARARGGDPRARAIVRAAQRELARAVRRVARRLALRGPIDASWAGSVLDDPWFRAGLMRAVARGGVRARWHRPEADAATAAARLAWTLAGGPPLGPRITRADGRRRRAVASRRA